MSAYDVYSIEIKGVSPLLMHNGAMSSPMSPIAREMKKITGKRKKVDSDFAELANLEFKGGLYVEKGQIVLPTLVLESALVEGAKASREGQTALSSMFVEPGGVFTYDGPTDIEARMEDPACRLVVGVRVQRNRVERCRPQFENWACRFRVSVVGSMIEPEMLKRWAEAAGNFKGLGDWRPRFGRFAVTAFEREISWE